MSIKIDLLYFLRDPASLNSEHNFRLVNQTEVHICYDKIN